MSIFTGLSSFVLTPMNEQRIDESSFSKLIQRLADAKVDSIGVMGSTGNYAYLSREERKRVLELAVDAADGVPLITSIGAVRTRQVLELAEDAQKVGAKALLLAPVSYQKLREEEVWALYKTVCANISVPLCIYDTPSTTQFVFSDELHARLAQLPNVAAIKLPGVPSIPADERLATERIARLRQLIPDHVAIGISHDIRVAPGLNAGCDVWFSVLGGLFPRMCQEMVEMARSGQHEQLTAASETLAPLWSLFEQYGYLRVTATLASMLGLTAVDNLPLPLRPLDAPAAAQLEAIIPLLY
ncbi:dihydrodipicolinate synthase family protein [Zymobacter sp. IVIA_5232.4 C2]|uniref:dihydrodipicolinate synthase family protein n=1 Tax=Zymobacter sp. IVIA_5232.4 C2 TaxID=3394855 RepID=UPI0039C2F4A6